MLTSLNGKLSLAIIGVLVCCVAGPARRDDIQYLPSNPQVVVSINLPAVMKSKTYQEFKKQKFDAFSKGLEEEMPREIGIPTANMARITMGLAFREKGDPEYVQIITTKQPVSAEDIKARIQTHKTMKNITYKEVKVGSFTIYQRTFQRELNDGKLSKVFEEKVFCVAEDKVVLVGSPGRLSGLQKILERNKEPELSDNLQAGLKAADLTNVIAVILDVQGIPPGERKEMVKEIVRDLPPLPGLKDVIEGVQMFAFKANEGKKVKASATVICKDADSAGAVKKVLQGGLDDLTGKLKDAKVAPEFQAMLKDAQAFLKTVKVSVKGKRVTAAVAAEPIQVVHLWKTMFYVQPYRTELAEPPTKQGEVKK